MITGLVVQASRQFEKNTAKTLLCFPDVVITTCVK